MRSLKLRRLVAHFYNKLMKPLSKDVFEASAEQVRKSSTERRLGLPQANSGSTLRHLRRTMVVIPVLFSKVLGASKGLSSYSGNENTLDVSS